MQHVESAVKLYFTNEYARFRMINGNRQLNEGKINRIIKEIRSGNDMLRYSPIQVKENGSILDILDGQHRFWISKTLQKPVYYVMVREEKSMADIARVNSNVEKWKHTDFVNCYAQQGNKNYLLLQQFTDQYGINVGTSIKLLTTGTPISASSGNEELLKIKFQEGRLEVKYFDSSCCLAEDWKRFAAFESHKDRNFLTAIYRIREAAKVSIDELVATFTKYPDVLTKQLTPKDYIYNLEQLFNTRKQKRTVII